MQSILVETKQMTQETSLSIEQQLAQLRIEWLKAKEEGNTSRMQTIALKGKCLKLKSKPDPFKDAEDIFLKV